MLKKLFISLIILSTLTSEGALNLPESIYNLYLSLTSVRILDGVQEVVPVQVQERQSGNTPSFFMPSNTSFILSAGSIEKLDYVLALPQTKRTKLSQFVYSVHEITLFLFVLSVFGIVLLFTSLHCKEAIIKLSDLSPPFIGP